MSISWGTQYPKLKTNLRLAINRLKMMGKKKTEIAMKSRTEIADYISGIIFIFSFFSFFVFQLIKKIVPESKWNI